MKRLKKKLLAMEPNTTNYTEMYNGSLAVADPQRPWEKPQVLYDPTYYNGEIGFRITGTHKLVQDKPTVTVIIPMEKIISDLDLNDTQGGMSLKRLKYYLRHMQDDTATYKEMYEGKMTLMLPPKYDPLRDEEKPVSPETHYSSLFFYDENISFSIDTTHKLAQDKPTVTVNIPAENFALTTLNDTAADYCLRRFAKYIDELNAELYNRSRPDNENGKYYLCRPGGEILCRNTAYFKLCPQRDYDYGSGSVMYLMPDDQLQPPKLCLCIRLQVQLPKKKLRKTIQMLCSDLPDAVERFVAEFDHTGLANALELAEKQASIRAWLRNSDYCAFVANGSILPRAKGTDLPMKSAIPFKSTPEDEIEVCGVRGMGIRKGVTVITGGGYSGKSTLLDAISAGIYDHVLGDGRELCITDPTAVTISAEDGRSVKHVNISPFIKWLPSGDTTDFSTDHASGSTSQAANIMEAVDCGAKLLLIDEDRSATNFMIRDKIMKELIEKEPITPFTDRVNELHREGVSTVLVIGGSGEYLSVADKVYMMEDYVIRDVTERSKKICTAHGVFAERTDELSDKASWKQHRLLYSDGFTSYPENSGTERLEVSDMGFIIIGDERIDVRGMHDIVSLRQLNALGFMLRYLEVSNKDRCIDITRRVDELYDKIAEEGLDCIYSSFFTTCERFLDLPRKQELIALISRMRKISFVAGSKTEADHVLVGE